MRINYIIYLLLLSILPVVSSYAQELSKKELKQQNKLLKKEKKALSPEAFQNMINEEVDLKKQEKSLRTSLEQAEKKRLMETNEMKELQRSLADAQQTLKDLSNQFLDLKDKEIIPTKEDVDNLARQGPIVTDNGVFFRVQLGAFVVKSNAASDDIVNICQTRDINLKNKKIYINRCLDEYFTSSNDFKYEGSFSRDQTQKFKKYMVGYFADYWEADTFKRLLREMGVSKAWIVPYVDGERVSLKNIIDTHPDLIFGKK